MDWGLKSIIDHVSDFETPAIKWRSYAGDITRTTLNHKNLSYLKPQVHSHVIFIHK